MNSGTPRPEFNVGLAVLVVQNGKFVTVVDYVIPADALSIGSISNFAENGFVR